jgi:tetratricopeptide (TPR) repeat protein
MKLFTYIVLCIALAVASCNSAKVITQPTTANVPITQKKIRTSDQQFFDANKARINKDVSAAKKGYLQSIKENPNNDAAHYYLAKLIVADGDYTVARKFAKKAVELDTANKYYLELYADVSAACDEYETAIDIYKNLAATDVKFAESYLMNKAYYETKSKKLDDAVATIQEIEKYYGVNPELSYRKINILKMQKKYDDVIKALDVLIADDPTELKYYLNKIDIYKQNKQDAKAKELTELIEKKFSNNTDLLSSNTLKAWQDKDTAKYLQLINTCINNTGLSVDEKVALLFPAIKIADTDTVMGTKVLQFAKQMADVHPQDAKSLLFYADMLVAKDMPKQATPLIYKVLEKKSQQLEPWQQLMNIYAQQQLHDSVIAVGTRAVKFFPNQATLHFLMGLSQQSNQNYTIAIKEYNKAIDFSGGNQAFQVQAYGCLGDLYNTTKRYKQSDSCFEEALKLDDEDATVLNNYAYFLSVRSEKLDKAEQMSKKSLEIRKNEKTFLDTYAWILYKQKKYDKAALAQKNALDAPGENDATMLEHYGDMLYQLGDKTQAKTYWLQAKQKGSKSEYLDKKIETGQLYE